MAKRPARTPSRRRKANPGAAAKRLLKTMTRISMRAGSRAVGRAAKAVAQQTKPPPGAGEWISGHAIGAGGGRRYFLFRPNGVTGRDRRPLLVMLHGCSQSARSFALSTRMNSIAGRAGAFVLYPEQDRRVNPQGCWNWFDTKTRQANAEAATLIAAIDQVCLFYPVDREAICVAGFSAGASMAALLATLHPERFRAVAMHSGVAPGIASSSGSAIAAMRGHHRPTAPAVPQSWPPLLVIHGTADGVVTANNALASARLWATSLGAREATQRTVQRGKRHATTVTDFRLGGRVVVSLHEIDRLAHAWSGGPPKQLFSDPAGPDASRLIWRFFSHRVKSAR